MITLIRAGEAMGSDQAAAAIPSVKDDLRLPAPFTAQIPLPASWAPVPREYALPPPAEAYPWNRTFSSRDFRPRAHSMFDADPAITNANDNLMMDRTVWQRLQEYRNHDRVRVLTLWESGASAVSIQTDRKGDPSLQWTSRLMNRGGATRGLLDRWMPATVFQRFARSGASSEGKAPNAAVLPHAGKSVIP